MGKYCPPKHERGEQFWNRRLRRFDSSRRCIGKERSLEDPEKNGNRVREKSEWLEEEV